MSCLCSVCLMENKATFNTIPVISWQWVLLVEETGEPGENHRPAQVTEKLYHIMLFTPSWSRFELTTSVVIGTDCIDSCKSNSYTITATTTPAIVRVVDLQLFTFVLVYLNSNLLQLALKGVIYITILWVCSPNCMYSGFHIVGPVPVLYSGSRSEFYIVGPNFILIGSVPDSIKRSYSTI
jgi:hypothetical protein